VAAGPESRYSGGGAGFRRKRLVFNVGASDASLNVFAHGVMRTDGLTVACVGIREDRDLHGQDNSSHQWD
jgi:hypothetical protein